MMYTVFADITMILHVVLGAFILLGGLLVLRYGWVLFLHVPVTVYSILVDFLGWPCPATEIEKWLRVRAGERMFESSFLETYFSWLGGDVVTASVFFGLVALVMNMAVYSYVWYRRGRVVEDGELVVSAR